MIICHLAAYLRMMMMLMSLLAFFELHGTLLKDLQPFNTPIFMLIVTPILSQQFEESRGLFSQEVATTFGGNKL